MSSSFTRPLGPRTPFAKQKESFNPIPSSSPAFATPAQPLPRRPIDAPRPPILPQTTDQDERSSSPNPGLPPPRRTAVPPVMPILLPPATLRPIAFRTFTKKHNLTLTSWALSALASFVGKNCGAGWREEGLAEMVLEEVARSWKKGDGKVIVDADGDRLKGILKALESCMIGGRIVGANKSSLSRQSSLIAPNGDLDGRPTIPREDSFGMSSLEVADNREEDDEHDISGGVRRWMKVVDAFEQPRLTFNPARKHFEKSKAAASFFPSPSQKTEMFRQRFHLVHQRLLRNESFQQSAIARSGSSHAWKVTQIANLLGRSGTGHLLLGLLSITPSGTLAINDLTGSLHLDLEQAVPIDEVETWICPGMILLVDGVYEEDFGAPGGTLGGGGGIGGTISGRFIAFSIGAPRCETRATSLGLSDAAASTDTGTIGGGFGWVDFLGVGSERAVGSRMRRIEQQTYLQQQSSQPDQHSSKLVMLGDLHLDQPRTFTALRKIFELYTALPPAAFILMGPFISNAALSSPSSNAHDISATSSIAYKEHFDALAVLLSDFHDLLRSCTFIFVPGDNDPWPSAFAAGAATALPRGPIPEMFTTRIRRAFAAAHNSTTSDPKDKRPPGEAIWTTNPARLTLFGPRHEIVLFRDDLSGRLRRTSISLRKQQQQQQETLPPSTEDVTMTDAQEPTPTLPSPTNPLDPATHHARRLTKTLLDQGHLAPFAPAVRPVHWSYAHALSLFPLPSALAICDPDADAFCVVYQGCCVVNPGRLVTSAGRRGGLARWIEMDAKACSGEVKEIGL